MLEGRKRGVIFDVGHGGGSFAYRVAVPLIKAGFLPDSISTDLHTSSMMGGMKDMLNLMSKFLALGMSVEDVVALSTWNPAREIKQEQLGNLSVGSPADIAVLRVEKGNYGFLDMHGARLKGTQRFACEMTLRDGRVIWDLNGLARTDWDKLPKNYGPTGDPRWEFGGRGRQARPAAPAK
jgi:dihydroorotase